MKSGGVGLFYQPTSEELSTRSRSFCNDDMSVCVSVTSNKYNGHKEF